MNRSTDQLTYVYRITNEDVIEFVNEAWLRFAIENDAPHLGQKVIGTSLWNYISGYQVVHLSKELLVRVRESKCEVSIPFRCDSSSVRRFMQMKIVPLTNGGVEFCNWTEREEPFLERIHLFDPTGPKDPEINLRMCAWCKKIHVGSSWFEIEDAIGRLRLFDHVAKPTITHGICDHCFRQLQGT